MEPLFLTLPRENPCLLSAMNVVNATQLSVLASSVPEELPGFRRFIPWHARCYPSG